MTRGPRQLNGFDLHSMVFSPMTICDANGWRTDKAFISITHSDEKPGIHPGLVCYLNHSASHAGAVTSIGRGHCMIRDSPGSISTRQTSRFFGVFAFFGFGSFFLMRSAIVRRGFFCSNIPCPLCKSPRFRGPSVYIPISLMSIVTMPST